MQIVHPSRRDGTYMYKYKYKYKYKYVLVLDKPSHEQGRLMKNMVCRL
jgi:hypothetical protein